MSTTWLASSLSLNASSSWYWSSTPSSRPMNEENTCALVNLTLILRPTNDSEDLVSNQMFLSFRSVKNVVVFPTICILGFLTNCLNVVVFYRQGLRQRINSCLFCLSLVDLLFVTLLFFIHVGEIRPESWNDTVAFKPVDPVSAFISKFHLVGFYGLGFGSMVVSTVIACERCLCVLLPLRSASLLRISTTRVILALGVLLPTACNFIVTEQYTTVCLQDVLTGQRISQTTRNEFYYNHRDLVEFMDLVVYGTVIPFVTVGGVTLATSVTVWQLLRVVKSRRDMSSSAAALSPRELSVTKMLVVLSVVFIVLNLPAVLFRVARFCMPEMNFAMRLANFYRLCYGLLEIFMAANVCSNFFVYLLTGSKYRATALDTMRCVFPCWRRGVANHGSVTEKTSETHTFALSVISER